MKKYNLTKSHICISNLNSIKNVAETFVAFFRNVSRIIFLFFEIVSKPIFDEKSLIQFVRLLNSPILGNCHSSPSRKMSSAICFCSHRKRLRSFFSITFCSGREVKGLFENDSKRSSKSSKCRQRRRRRRRSSKKVTLSSFFSGFYFPG